VASVVEGDPAEPSRPHEAVEGAAVSCSQHRPGAAVSRPNQDDPQTSIRTVTTLSDFVPDSLR
jgi:hypothetical protein